MSAHALIVGSLYRAAETREGKSGPYSLATIRADGELKFWSVLAFDPTARAELERLAVGEALSVQGVMSAKRYEKGGVTKISLNIVADHVLALRQPARERKREARRPLANDEGSDAASVPFNDDVPF